MRILHIFVFTDARSEESLVMRIFNPDYQTSDAEMNAALKKADLPSHGYKKELITSLSSESDSDKPVYEKKYFYYKTVECSRAREVVQELQTLMPGIDVFSFLDNYCLYKFRRERRKAARNYNNSNMILF